MDKFKQKALNDSEYMGYISDIYYSEHFRIMDTYLHHDRYTRLDHCLHVSYSTYIMLRKIFPGYRYLREACRGSLLHDFFLYDWHTENPFPIPCFHAWKHPERAYNDAVRYFSVNEMEKNIILTHMFPLSGKIPYSKAAWLVITYDKYWAVKEGLTTFDPVKMIKMQIPDFLKSKKE